MKKYVFTLIGTACLAAAIFSSCSNKEDNTGQLPAAAGIISGADANTLPAVTVELSIAPIDRAESYQWYKDDVAINSANSLTYTVTETGVYSVEGVNSFGRGERSEDKLVTITLPLPDAAGTISGADSNTLPAVTVELSIQPVQYATSYQWYKDNVAISGADGLTYTVTETGVYSVEGVNSFGRGERSEDKLVTITLPLPDAAGTISGADANTLPAVTVELSIQPVQYATSYQWYKDNVAISGADGLTYTVTETGVYSVEGVNSVGAGPRSPDKTVTITLSTQSLKILFYAEGGGIYKADMSNPSTIQKISDYDTSIQCMAYANGTVYGITYTDYGANDLITINENTGDVTVVISNITCDGLGMAYNSVDGKTYVSTWDGTALGTINLATGEFTTITNSIGAPSFIAIDNDGICYLQTINGTGGSIFCTVDLSTGVLETILTREISVNYIQNMSVDPETNTLYWIHRGNGLTPTFNEVNKGTGEYIQIYDFASIQASSFTVLP